MKKRKKEIFAFSRKSGSGKPNCLDEQKGQVTILLLNEIKIWVFCFGKLCLSLIIIVKMIKKKHGLNTNIYLILFIIIIPTIIKIISIIY